MADTDKLIREWEASPHKAYKIAAGIARKIAKKNSQRYDELPLNSTLSTEYEVSESTVRAAKGILREHDILILENRRYYVALSRQPRPQTSGKPKRHPAWKKHHHHHR